MEAGWKARAKVDWCSYTDYDPPIRFSLPFTLHQTPLIDWSKWTGLLGTVTPSDVSLEAWLEIYKGADAESNQSLAHRPNNPQEDLDNLFRDDEFTMESSAEGPAQNETQSNNRLQARHGVFELREPGLWFLRNKRLDFEFKLCLSVIDQEGDGGSRERPEALEGPDTEDSNANQQPGTGAGTQLGSHASESVRQLVTRQLATRQNFLGGSRTESHSASEFNADPTNSERTATPIGASQFNLALRLQLQAQPNLSISHPPGLAAILQTIYDTIKNPENPTRAERDMAGEMQQLFPHLFCDERTKLLQNGPNRYSRVVHFNGQHVGVANFFQELLPRVQGFSADMTIFYVMAGIHARTSLVPYFWFRRIRVRFDNVYVGDIEIDHMPNPLPPLTNFEDAPSRIFQVHDPLRSSQNPPVDIPNAPPFMAGPNAPVVDNSIAALVVAPPAAAAAAAANANANANAGNAAAAADAAPDNVNVANAPVGNAAVANAPAANAPAANAPVANAPGANAPLTALPGHLFQQDGRTRILSYRSVRKMVYGLIKYNGETVGEITACEEMAATLRRRHVKQADRFAMLFQADGQTQTQFNAGTGKFDVYYEGDLFGDLKIDHPTRGL
ncbi:hypothetical protein F4811DRAFT_263496 [Daldinia bambusicola]|nr:hypothetical protein F4811DRAFT_263496 [Daldinia bambusicola]